MLGEADAEADAEALAGLDQSIEAAREAREPWDQGTLLTSMGARPALLRTGVG